jgi:hypothetical protein
LYSAGLTKMIVGDAAIGVSAFWLHLFCFLFPAQ